MRDVAQLPCPACGFATMDSVYGSYAICEICGWEDDPVQLANPACPGGANSDSLIDAQLAALARYPIGIELANVRGRDPRWRPLTEDERRAAELELAEQRWKNRAALNPSDHYWLKHGAPREDG